MDFLYITVMVACSLITGGASGCDVVKLSQCIQPLHAFVSQLSSGSPPNAETLQAMCSGYNQFKACKPASCDNSPLLQDMTSDMAVLDASCGGSGGGSGEGSGGGSVGGSGGGSAGGSSERSGGASGCDIVKLSQCMQPLQASVGQLLPGPPPNAETLQALCSGYNQFKACKPASCDNSPLLQGVTSAMAILDASCGGSGGGSGKGSAGGSGGGSVGGSAGGSGGGSAGGSSGSSGGGSGRGSAGGSGGGSAGGSSGSSGTSGSDKIQMSFWATILLIAGAMIF